MRRADRLAPVRGSRTISGFPTGVSGSELTRRALTQAQRLGAEFLAPVEVTGVRSTPATSASRSATGASWSRGRCSPPPGWSTASIPRAGIAEHTGAGVYYGAATTEAPAFAGRRVLVVGGGNSAGQAACTCRATRERCRSSCAAKSCATRCRSTSIDQIEKTPNIRLRTRTEVARVEGDGHVERVGLEFARRWRSAGWSRVDAVFVFIGTRPHSEWLPADVLRDDEGFVLTGRDLMAVPPSRACGRNRASRCRSRRACPASSPPATSAPAR